MHNRLLIPVLILFCWAALAPGKDDDVEFATALGKEGYTWLAIKEFEKLKDSPNERERILRHRGLAQLYAAKDEFRMRDRHNALLLKEGANSRDPEVRAAIKAIKGKVWDNKEQTLIRLVDKIEFELQDDPPDEKVLAKLRRDARELSEEILRYRQGIVTGYEEDEEKGMLPEKEAFKLDQAKFFLARSMYYHSFTFKGDNEAKRKSILEEASKDYFQTLAFMYEDKVILIPYFTAMSLWELEKYKQASLNFIKCIDFPAGPSNDNLRKDAYYRAVECYYRINDYKGAAQSAFDYLIEYASPADKTSSRGHSIRLALANSVYKMDATEYDEVKELFGYKGKQDEEAAKILVAIESENGPKSSEARKVMSDIVKGYLKYIADGVQKFLDKDYSKAAAALQKGIAEAPKNLAFEASFTKLAQAWYYLGFSYFYRKMYPEAIVCFKEGTTRFMKDYREKGDRLTQEQKQWFLHNRENWKNVAGKYYKDNKSDFSLDVFKEALIAFSQVRGDGEEEDAGLNININIAIIAMRNDEYGEAIAELRKVKDDDPDYGKALRLTAQCKWGLYEQGDLKDKKLATQSFDLYDQVLKMLKERIEGAADEEEAQPFEAELADTNGRLIGMLYKDKQYVRILDGVETFWANPPKSKSIGVASARYQIYSALKVKIATDTLEGARKKEKAFNIGKSVLERMKRDFSDEKEKIQKTVKVLGFAYYNLAGTFLALGKAEDSDRLLNESGSLLYEFIMNSGTEADEAVLIPVADILHKKLKDYKRSEDVTGQILKNFKARAGDLYDPAAAETQKELTEIRNNMLDRTEARNVWDFLIDRMYDGPGEDGQPRSRSYFKETVREFWKEQPYSYEEAYVHLGEAIMIELGLTPEEREEMAKLRDAESGEEAEKFWTKLFADYKEAVNRDPKPFQDLHKFLDNAIFTNNYKYRLAECYRHNGKLDEALEIFSELDDYYISEPSTKWEVANTLLTLAEAAKDKAVKETKAMLAKDGYLWIEKNTPPTKPGQEEHYEAVLRGAECYAIIGNVQSARGKLNNALLYDNTPFPTPEIKQKLVDKIAEYDKKLAEKGAPKQ